MERETRFELATLCLGSRCSTAELLPLGGVGLILAHGAIGGERLGVAPWREPGEMSPVRLAHRREFTALEMRLLLAFRAPAYNRLDKPRRLFVVDRVTCALAST